MNDPRRRRAASWALPRVLAGRSATSDFAIQHALITGAAGAIGSAIARRWAKLAPNARLSLVDRDEAKTRALATELGGHALIWDLARPDALDLGGLEPIDALVNCAGIMELKSVAATPWGEAKRLLDIDLVSPLFLLSQVAGGMRDRRGGFIVNVASMAGLVPLRGAAYYGASKAGLAMASEIARLELAPFGVRVVTVYPGPVASGLERHARGQLEPSWLSKALPTGDAEVLADLIVSALERGEPRVIYPPLYVAAAEVLSIAKRVTARWSPAPRE